MTDQKQSEDPVVSDGGHAFSVHDIVLDGGNATKEKR